MWIDISVIGLPEGISDRPGEGVFLFRKTGEEAPPGEAVFQRPRWPLVPEKTLLSPALPSLQIRCLGDFEVQRGGEPLVDPRWRRRKVQTLFKLLVTHRGRRVHKDEIAEALWPEGSSEEANARNLKVLVYTLRRVLEPGIVRGEDSRVIAREGDSYFWIVNGNRWLDVEAFLMRLQRGKEQEQGGSLAAAVAEYEGALPLYQGDYLPHDLYQDWCALERERLQEHCLDCLACLASLYSRTGDWKRGIQCCRRALARDPLRESVHRQTMYYLWQGGRRDEALAQFRRCGAILSRELGISPLPETVDLYQEILRHPSSQEP